VALIAAVMHPRRVRVMALYEPTLFALLDAESPHRTPPTASAAWSQAQPTRLTSAIPPAQRRCFIDYWMGEVLGSECLRHAKRR
jgi:hypothetical protein